MAEASAWALSRTPDWGETSGADTKAAKTVGPLGATWVWLQKGVSPHRLPCYRIRKHIYRLVQKQFWFLWIVSPPHNSSEWPGVTCFYNSSTWILELGLWACWLTNVCKLELISLIGNHRLQEPLHCVCIVGGFWNIFNVWASALMGANSRNLLLGSWKPFNNTYECNIFFCFIYVFVYSLFWKKNNLND